MPEKPKNQPKPTARDGRPGDGRDLLPDVTSDESGGFDPLDDDLLRERPPHHNDE